MSVLREARASVALDGETQCVPECITITVPKVPPSHNQLLRMHWARRKREMAEWCEWLTAGMNGAEQDGQRKVVREIRRRVVAGERNRMEIEIHHSRSDDPDNLWGRGKLIFDAAKYKRGAGLIWDDDTKHLAARVTQVKCKRKDAKTVIRVMPA